MKRPKGRNYLQMDTKTLDTWLLLIDKNDMRAKNGNVYKNETRREKQTTIEKSNKVNC